MTRTFKSHYVSYGESPDGGLQRLINLAEETAAKFHGGRLTLMFTPDGWRVLGGLIDPNDELEWRHLKAHGSLALALERYHGRCYQREKRHGGR